MQDKIKQKPYPTRVRFPSIFLHLCHNKNRSMAKILVTDDESSIRRTLKEILEYEKHEVDLATDGPSCLELARSQTYDVILLDVKMPEMDGLEVLERLMATVETPVIMISGHGTIQTAVEAIKKGAYDFIVKPPDLNRLLVSVRNACDKQDLMQQTRKLKHEVEKKYEMVGESQAINAIHGMIAKVAPTSARILITGENGTGKELVARQIHQLSNRSFAPFIEVNCAAIPSELIESQLFGHEKGAFTSAVKQRKGDFELAHGGTLFLDEIGDMSQSAQAKVLRALQENKITRVGGEKDIPVDVRIIAATNKNLKEEIAAGRFREDLYHRLSVIVIEVPPLRERRDDIARLTRRFIEETCRQQGRPVKEIDEEALEALRGFNWSGNVRELRNVVERLVILCDGRITMADIEKYVQPVML